MKNVLYSDGTPSREWEDCPQLDNKKALEALDLILENCEASASTYKERIEMIHKICRKALGATDPLAGTPDGLAGE